MTLKELYSLVEGEKKEGKHTCKELQNSNLKIIVREILSSSSPISVLTVYENGLVLFQEDKRYTVFHISDVVSKDVIYDSGLYEMPDIEERRVSKDELLNYDWKVALYMEGSERIANNRDKTECYHILFSFDSTNDETREKYLGYTPNLNAAFEKTLELQRYKEVIDMVRSKLSDAEWNTYFNVEVLGMHQDDLAKQEGISQQAISKRYLKACRLIEKYREEFRNKYYED